MTEVERGTLSVSGSGDHPLVSVTARFIRRAGLPPGGSAQVLAVDGAVVLLAPDVDADRLVSEAEIAEDLTTPPTVDDERVAALDAIWEDLTGEAVSR